MGTEFFSISKERSVSDGFPIQVTVVGEVKALCYESIRPTGVIGTDDAKFQPGREFMLVPAQQLSPGRTGKIPHVVFGNSAPNHIPPRLLD